MTRLRRRRVGLLLAAATAAGVSALALAPAQGFTGIGPRGAVAKTTPVRPVGLPGTSCQVFPQDNYWNTPVSALPVDAHSAAWLSHMHPTAHLHPDFGPSYGDLPVPYGIPITVVSGTHPKVSVAFTYASESDRIGYPLGSDTKIEGGAGASGDRHAIVVDKTTCRVYETYATRSTTSGWKAGSGATWLLTSNALRHDGWTSADAAGLPILPGLLRLDEVKAGRVTHAIRFTTDVSDTSYIWPARHQAGSVSSSNYPPMGARFRLKASFSTAGYRSDTKTVLTAMKTYGLVLADNGSSWYFQGTSENGWPEGLLDELKSIPASAFEAVDTSGMQVSANSGAAR